ncbi:Transposase [Cordylochernes scorpioides]|uniref:Transposase n=1 Tax=Cordylochernes scorpioides TaxID=51811 RepID=A0ABY6KLI4_9ARAC|nr:Transposase [Cordylochernes scorpioides]
MEWHRVVFSDESRFCLSSDSRRVGVWRRRGERSNPAAIVERPTVRQRGIMVWGAIAYDSRSPLLRIQGTMTAQRYVYDVLRPVTLPYLQGVPNALYQQDNARPHTARISQQALQDIQMLPWPPYSSDLSPIEHVWDIIGRRLHALPQPRSEDELWQMVEREWRAIPQDAIRTLIDSLPRRVAACIAVRGHRKRRQFKQTDAFTRGMVIGLKRAGWSIRQIAADTHLGASTVHRLWRRWLEQGNVAIYRNAGATRVTSARVDRRILRQAVAAPQATCTAILQHVQDTLDHSILTRTISRRLVANGLHSCRPLRRLPLTPPNRRQRLEWCRARSTWMTEWHRVVFSDESRFCLSSDSRRVRVWRRRGERSNPAAIVERPTVRQRGLMVWDAIAYDSRSPLLRIQGTMTAQRYVDDVLRPVTLPYLQGVPDALYQQDNARPHTARISQQSLQDVQMLPWPPYSPDLSPIEHVWDIIGRRLHALPQPRSEDELWQMVERERRAIPQDAIRTLIDSLPRRVAACIAVRGGPTCY